jgi:hypothetical protein
VNVDTVSGETRRERRRDGRRERSSVVSHDAANMAMMEDPTEGFGEGIGRVDDARDMDHDDVAVAFPLLQGEVLNIDMARALGGLAGVGHQNSGLIIFVELRWTRLRIAEVGEDGAEVLCSLGGLNSGDEFGFGRGGGNHGLELGAVCNSSAAQGENGASDGAPGLGVGTIGGIDITNKGQGIRRKRESR